MGSSGYPGSLTVGTKVVWLSLRSLGSPSHMFIKLCFSVTFFLIGVNVLFIAHSGILSRYIS